MGAREKWRLVQGWGRREAMDQVKEAARAASDFQSHPLLTLINTSHCPTEEQGMLSLFSTSLRSF